MVYEIIKKCLDFIYFEYVNKDHLYNQNTSAYARMHECEERLNEVETEIDQYQSIIDDYDRQHEINGILRTLIATAPISIPLGIYCAGKCLNFAYHAFYPTTAPEKTKQTMHEVSLSTKKIYSIL